MVAQASIAGVRADASLREGIGIRAALTERGHAHQPENRPRAWRFPRAARESSISGNNLSEQTRGLIIGALLASLCSHSEPTASAPSKNEIALPHLREVTLYETMIDVTYYIVGRWSGVSCSRVDLPHESCQGDQVRCSRD